MPKFLRDSIYLLLILLLTVSNFFFYINYQQNIENIRILNQKVGDLEKENQELRNKPPLGWKEYTDDKYKFTIWYPETFVYYNQPSKVEIEKRDNIKTFLLSDIREDGVTPISIAGISVEESYLGINEYIKDDIQTNYASYVGNKISSLDQYITKEKSNGIDLYKIEIPNEILMYYIKNYNLIFTFNPSVTVDEYPDNEHREVFDQMVKSFRFTE